MTKAQTTNAPHSNSKASTGVTTAFDAAAAALADEAVRTTPAHPAAWLKWATGVAAVAARDSASLVKVPLEDGALTSAEIIELAPLVEYVRVAKTRFDAARANTDVSLADAKFLASIRADQQVIVRAFRTLRFRRNKVGLALIASIVRGSPEDAQDAVQDNTGLLSLCNSGDHEKWLATLPNGEGAAAQRLWDRHNELVALAARSTLPTGVHDARERLHRLWSLLRLRLERVLIAGRYLTAGVKARRGDYRGFRRPASRPTKAVTTPVVAGK